MSFRSGLVCVLAVLFLTSGIAAGAGSGIAPQPAAPAEIAPQPAAPADVEYDSTLLRIDLQENGTAAWTIEYRVNLDDENATEAFESLQEDIRANRSEFESQFASRMNRTARAAENATGREMTVRNVSVETDRDEIQRVGIVAYNFTWTNFAVADGDKLRAGDAISGFVLDSGTTLFFTWPDAYRNVDNIPNADEKSDGSATWFGRTTFANDEPRLVLERGTGTSGNGDTPTPTGDGPPGDGTTTVPPETQTRSVTHYGTRSPGDGTTTVPPEKGELDLPLLGIGAVVLLSLAAAAWYVWRREAGPGFGGDAGDGTDGDATGGETAVAGDEDGEPSDGAGGEVAADPPEELLSNEERVLRLLGDNGGRMKQQQVVQELDWTDAKTSQVVGNLREDGEVDVFRIGRENVLALPDETDFPP
ncbi:MAG: helix-turn-helix transcriptional regulator [Halobacteriales archaeon]